jgi:hypothetical protein
LGVIQVTLLLLLFIKLFGNAEEEHFQNKKFTKADKEKWSTLRQQGRKEQVVDVALIKQSKSIPRRKTRIGFRNKENDNNPTFRTKFIWNNKNMCKYGEQDEIVNGSDPYPVLLVTVHSRRDHFLNRETIRHTYGNLYIYKNWDVRVIFIIGQGSKNKAEAKKNNKDDHHIRLSWEFTTYGDLIMGK